MNLDMGKEENDVYDIVPSSATSERDIFNIEYEEESGFTNLGSTKNEPLVLYIFTNSYKKLVM